MSEESSSESARKLVLPGDLMETKSKPGRGIFRKDGQIHASVVGHSSDKSGYINVNGIKGRYNPKTGDKIVTIRGAIKAKVNAFAKEITDIE